MNTQATTRTAAFSLASLLTLAVLASINFMATSPAPEAMVAAIDGPASQTIVIEAKRDRA